MKLKPTQILLVEDTSDFAKLIQKLLAHSHRFVCRLDHVESLGQALARVRAGDVDVVLLDLQLPDGKGVDLVKEVRGATSAAAIVVLTGVDDDSVAIQAVRQGAQDYLVKGRISSGLLVRSIRQAMERKRTEDELQSAYAEIEHLFAAIPSILISVDEATHVTRWNVAASKALGVDADQALGKRLGECAVSWDARRILSHVDMCLRRATQVSCEHVSFRSRSVPEGILAFTASPIVKPGKPCAGCLLLMSDITQRRALEAQLSQAQRLESIGRLASGIAHEINTPVQYVTDNTRFLDESFASLLPLLESFKLLHRAAAAGRVSPDAIAQVDERLAATDVDFVCNEVPTAIRQSLEGLERVTKIVRAVKDFSHPGGAEKVAVDIHRAIESTIVVARNEWKYVADLTTNFDKSMPHVRCFPDEFNQVVLNLIVNASHAIGDAIKKGLTTKGQITITTRNAGMWAEIDVQDSGTGIPESIRDRIFEPFFTTKEVGKGTGQGLSMAYAVIVKKHGGAISFDSKPNQGTVFKIRLPLSVGSSVVVPKPLAPVATGAT
jgi:signal transduction histidine kinase